MPNIPVPRVWLCVEKYLPYSFEGEQLHIPAPAGA